MTKDEILFAIQEVVAHAGGEWPDTAGEPEVLRRVKMLARMAASHGEAQAGVLEDAARWHWMAEYIVGTRTDLDDEIIASATVDELRKLVDADLAARKQGATK